MKVPKGRKMSSGKYFIQLRLGGESIPVSDWDEKKCIREAQRIKAEYLAGKRLPPPPDPESEPEKDKGPTLKEAIDAYIADRVNVLSPSTIRGYRTIQKTHFLAVMDMPIDEITDDRWQTLVNIEAKKYSPKTLKNTWGIIKTVMEYATQRKMPDLALPAPIPHDTAFLTPTEIELFVAAVKDTPHAVPALLGLMSCRISEILAIRWEDIPKNADFIKIRGAVIPDEHHKYSKRRQNKNETSSRSIPIIIPELKEALERDRKPNGPILTIDQAYFRRWLKDICKDAGITAVTPHGLRHSFASLSYHLQIPERIAMDIGGWKTEATMRKIYTHVAQTDISRYATKMADFYSGKLKQDGKNANKNAN